MALLPLAWLAATSLIGPPREPLHVIGGATAGECQWPTTVLMQGCSGTLVHPEIVLYAAHCPDTGQVRFGVTGNERAVSTEYCEGAPEYPELGFDYKYCKLAEPVTDVPIIPVIMGCEVDQLTIDRPVVLVGFGNTSNEGGGFGTKRWIDGVVAGFPNDGRKIGIFYEDNTVGICSGDSGGSAFVQLDDGSWRHFAITSTVAGTCGGSSQHIPSYHAVAWVEEHSGIDITPCHDADGAWNPSDGCTGFPLDPNDGEGLSWNDGCGPGMTSGASATCGPAVGEPQDDAGPTITFVEPQAGAHDGPTFATPIEVEASDDFGILDVTIAFEGIDPVLLEAEPYRLGSVQFPEGVYEITAVARDWSGNVAEASVTIEIGDVAMESGEESGTTTTPATSGATTTGGSASTGDPVDTSSEGSGEGTSGGATGGGDDGCGCRSTPTRPIATLLPLLGVFSRRRRRFSSRSE